MAELGSLGATIIEADEQMGLVVARVQYEGEAWSLFVS